MSFILMCLVSCLFSADTNSAAHFDLAFAHGKINNLFWLVNLLFCSKLFWGMCCDKDQIVAEKTRLCLKLQVGELKINCILWDAYPSRRAYHANIMTLFMAAK